MRASTAFAALTAAGVAGLGYALAEAHAYTLRSYTVPVLPSGTAPIRLLHLSDLHLLTRQHRKVAWVRSLARLEPDVVVSTGDNLSAPDAVPAVLRAYGDLLERPGVFVLGSNDYWAPRVKNPARYLLRHGGRKRLHGERLPTDDLVAAFSGAGWLGLSNQRATLTIGDTLLEFVGVDDPHLGYDRHTEVAGPPDPAADLTIGVAHAPYRRILDPLAADGARLLLAGHTHGGQLRLPGYGALVTNCDLPRGQARGVSRWPATDGEGWLHVSAGIGTSPYTPVRFSCRPEASLITLVGEDALA